MERYRDYDPFAWLYATHWGSDYHKQAYDVLHRLLLHELQPGAAVLDLCCGDGRLAEVLHRRGFNVTGLDGSERMLEFARRRCPQVRFLAGDARSFELGDRFDAVLSTFDALNHVMSSEEFAGVCRSVAKALVPGGYFAFDLNREEAFTEEWPRTFAEIESDMVCVSQGAYSPFDRVATAEITLFRLLDGKWERSDFRLSEYAHREAEVLQSLSAAGFIGSQVYDAETDLGMYGSIGRARCFFLARRPRAE